MTSFESADRRTASTRLPEVEAGVRLAHRLRTPLATVKSAAQLIQRLEMDPREASSYLSSIVQAVDRMSGCIARFEELLQIEVPAGVSSRVQPAVVEAVSAMAETMELHHASVSFSGPRDVTAPLPHRVQVEVVSELLRNAAVHGGGGVTIGVSWRSLASEGCRLEVEDSGRGVPEEVAPRVLQPYFSTVEYRTGIGLTRIGLIADRAGGALMWENRPDGGCRFIVEFKGEPDGPVSHR